MVSGAAGDWTISPRSAAPIVTTGGDPDATAITSPSSGRVPFKKNIYI